MERRYLSWNLNDKSSESLKISGKSILSKENRKFKGQKVNNISLFDDKKASMVRIEPQLL